MKKSLLFAFAMCGAVAINAMEPLSAEQLAKLTIQINDFSDNSFALSATVGPEYADESNKTLIQIQNFNGEGLPLRMNVDWENGTVSVSPYTFSSEFNEDDYMNYYLMVVSEEAANLSSPMDDAFTKSTVTGTISESAITLDSWNIVAVHPYFTSMTKKYDKPLSTKIITPNATMTIQRRDVNWDIEDENYASPIEDAEVMTYGVYTKVDGNKLYVYNWDNLPSCVELTQKSVDGKFTYTTNADDYIYIRNSRYQYGLYPFDGKDSDSLWDVEAAPLESEPVTNRSELNFGGWITYAVARTSERTIGGYAKLALDTPLELGTSGIDETVAAGAPVKVTYFNLNGIETAEPAAGIFVKVSTYADGSVKTEKVAK
ncbi:MAG: hypothetical protein K2G79_01085 [Muribaculum sp.]|nr:hypothetical protein [Muribaculum sp.]